MLEARQYISLFLGDLESALTIACSLAPEPTTKILFIKKTPCSIIYLEESSRERSSLLRKEGVTPLVQYLPVKTESSKSFILGLPIVAESLRSSRL
jgi:hypothetical protein